MKDVREQMAEFSKSIIEELRGRLASAPRFHRERSHSEEAIANCRPPSQPHTPRFQWDAQGRPICSKCGEVGHISRFCHPRRASQGDF